MQIVSPYRPQAPESREHRELGPFDWIAALRMLAESVEHACGCRTYALTDRSAKLGVPSFAYRTTRRPLMLWILEVSLRFIESDAFNQDTVMLSPDLLVYDDLAPYFRADLGVVVRTEKHQARPILNGAQWWAVSAKSALAAFYRRALDLADVLPRDLHIWGADTVPLVDLLAPVTVGPSRRAGLEVEGIAQREILQTLSRRDCDAIDAGASVRAPKRPIVDFRLLRKRYMRAYFDQTIGARL